MLAIMRFNVAFLSTLSRTLTSLKAFALLLQDFVPRRITVNGTPCALGLTPNVTVVPEEFSQAANDTPNLSSFAVAGAVGTNGTQLVGVDGLPLTLRGVNWFGFETQVYLLLDWHLFSHMPEQSGHNAVWPWKSLLTGKQEKCWALHSLFLKYGIVKSKAFYIRTIQKYIHWTAKSNCW